MYWMLLFLAYLQELIVDYLGILALFQLLFADNFSNSLRISHIKQKGMKNKWQHTVLKSLIFP